MASIRREPAPRTGSANALHSTDVEGLPQHPGPLGLAIFAVGLISRRLLCVAHPRPVYGRMRADRRASAPSSSSSLRRPWGPRRFSGGGSSRTCATRVGSTPGSRRDTASRSSASIPRSSTTRRSSHPGGRHVLHGVGPHINRRVPGGIPRNGRSAISCREWRWPIREGALDRHLGVDPATVGPKIAKTWLMKEPVNGLPPAYLGRGRPLWPGRGRARLVCNALFFVAGAGLAPVARRAGAPRVGWRGCSASHISAESPRVGVTFNSCSCSVMPFKRWVVIGVCLASRATGFAARRPVDPAPRRDPDPRVYAATCRCGALRCVVLMAVDTLVPAARRVGCVGSVDGEGPVARGVRRAERERARESAPYHAWNPDYPLLIPVDRGVRLHVHAALDTLAIHLQFWLIYAGFLLALLQLSAWAGAGGARLAVRAGDRCRAGGRDRHCLRARRHSRGDHVRTRGSVRLAVARRRRSRRASAVPAVRSRGVRNEVRGTGSSSLLSA